jgi:hypothetical protein
MTTERCLWCGQDYRVRGRVANVFFAEHRCTPAGRRWREIDERTGYGPLPIRQFLEDTKAFFEERAGTTMGRHAAEELLIAAGRVGIPLWQLTELFGTRTEEVDRSSYVVLLTAREKYSLKCRVFAQKDRALALAQPVADAEGMHPEWENAWVFAADQHGCRAILGEMPELTEAEAAAEGLR